MANQFTDRANSTDFIGNTIIQAFGDYLMPINAFTVSATNELGFRGMVVPCLNIASGEVLDYDTNGTYVMSPTTASSINVVLDHHKFISWQCKDSEMRDSALINNESFYASRGQLLASSILTQIFTDLTGSANTPISSSIALTAFSASAISNLSLEMDNLLIPSGDRSLVLNATYATRLRQDSALQNAAAFGQDSVIRKGVIPSVDKFNAIYQVSVLPAGTVGYCFHKGSILYAQRSVQPAVNNLCTVAKTYTDDNGFSLTYLQFRDELMGATNNIISVEFGYKISNPNGIIRLY